MKRRTKDWPACRARRTCAAASLILVATGLAACMAPPPWYATASTATLSEPELVPHNERPIASGVRVRMEADYSIADFVDRSGVYYAVGEVHAPDHKVIFMQGCGRLSRSTLTEPSGSIRLYCDMTVPVKSPDNRRVHLAMRLYQRTGPDVSQMIASSEPVPYELRNNDVIHRDLRSMTPCVDIMQDDGMVHVCKF